MCTCIWYLNKKQW